MHKYLIIFIITGLIYFKIKYYDHIFQPNLYPTIGLQTPGEIVDVNFGQQDFIFDIDEMKKVSRNKNCNSFTMLYKALMTIFLV